MGNIRATFRSQCDNSHAMDARSSSSNTESPWLPFESRRRARDEKREAVLRMAVALFLEQGYHRATLNEVARRLNITKPALYNYFRSKDEILRLLNEAHVPCAPVKTAREVAYDHHLEARGFWVDIDHPKRGRTRVPISPIRLHAGGKAEIRQPAPTLGQHTEAVLSELLGITATELTRLRNEKVTVPVT